MHLNKSFPSDENRIYGEKIYQRMIKPTRISQLKKREKLLKRLNFAKVSRIDQTITKAITLGEVMVQMLYKLSNFIWKDT